MRFLCFKRWSGTQSFAFTIGIGTTILVCSLIRRLFSKI